MAIPVLPIPPDQYNKVHFNELNRVLRLFFTSVDNPQVLRTARIQVLDSEGDAIIDAQMDASSGKTHIILTDLPTSASGLTTGTIYNDSGTLKVA